MAKFCRIRFKKFLARGNAVEKIGDADGRSCGKAGRLNADKFSTREFEPRALGFRFVARFEEQARDGGNRWKRFAAEAQRRNGKQIVSGSQLARCVALEGQQRVVVDHAVAVVNDADHALAADFRFDTNGLRASVQRVFEQFLYYRSGGLDNFACSDFIRHRLRQYPDSAHESPDETRLL